MGDEVKQQDTRKATSSEMTEQITPKLQVSILNTWVAYQTHVGQVRSHNEDWVEVYEPEEEQVLARKGSLYIVADGMGGHRAGEVASQGAAQETVNSYYADANTDIIQSLTDAVKKANKRVYRQSMENPEQMGMGTTLVAAVLHDANLYIANVGDSRAYLIREGEISQITNDHSWVEEQVRVGIITSEQARHHPQRNVITRAMGSREDVKVDIFTENWQSDDILVMCTDGLSGLVEDDEIRDITLAYPPEEAVAELINTANDRGGVDNISVIVLSSKFDNENDAPEEEQPKSPIKKLQKLADKLPKLPHINKE